MTIFNKTCTFNVENGALLTTKVASLRLCSCQGNFAIFEVLEVFLFHIGSKHIYASKGDLQL